MGQLLGHEQSFYFRKPVEEDQDLDEVFLQMCATLCSGAPARSSRAPSPQACERGAGGCPAGGACFHFGCGGLLRALFLSPHPFSPSLLLSFFSLFPPTSLSLSRPAILDSHSYQEAVPECMDLRTVAEKLAHGHFLSLDDVAADLALIWHNARLFHRDSGRGQRCFLLPSLFSVFLVLFVSRASCFPPTAAMHHSCCEAPVAVLWHSPGREY